MTDLSAMETEQPVFTNGPGAAAMLATAIGCLAFAVVAFAGDKSPAVKVWLIFYKPTGPLSGVAFLGSAAWLGSWILLGFMWERKSVNLQRVIWASSLLLGIALLLTFPPVVDLL